MRRLLTLLSGLSAALFGCGPHPPDVVQPTGDGLAVAVPSSDPAVEEATRQARDSLDGFIERLAAPRPGQSDFSIKVPIAAGDGTHHLWLQDVAIDGSGFRGTLGPDAAGLGGHRPGERVEIERHQVEDWLYVEGGKLAGGFSLRAIRKQLSGKAREAFERSMWFTFE